MIKACKKCRRAGEKLLLKGERCISIKCAVLKRPYAPGTSGKSFRGKQSEYGKQLREKQNLKNIYGISEKQMERYAKMAEKTAGNSAENLMRCLEIRVDNLVFRAGLASSRSYARQIISHGLATLNNKKITVPSCLIKEGDIIKISKTNQFKDISKVNIPSWMEFNIEKLEIKIKYIPLREEIDTTINESLIIEFYSR